MLSACPTPFDRDSLLAGRALRWELGGAALVFGPRPLLMGIVNVTPDSFSDGGRFLDPDAAVAHALRLVREGADILDIGGESTRPGSRPVDAEEQLRRILPVLKRLAQETAVPLSVDTQSAAVAEAALGAGAQIINDISALTADPQMLGVVRRAGCGVCAMHMQGTPETMQRKPEYLDVVAEVYEHLRTRCAALRAAGLRPQQIALDPGLGFGKTTAHNLRLIREAWRFHALGCPLLVGPSRKRFLGDLLGDPQADRTAATVGVALALADCGVQILRVHDVAPVRQALLTYQACREA